MPSARALVIELAIVLAITLVVAFLGPFGSFALGGFETCFLYWGVMIIGGYAIVRPIMLLAPVLIARLQLPEAAVWIGLLAVAAMPVTLLVWFGNGSGTLPSPTEFLRLYPNVLLIGSLVTLVFWAIRRPSDVQPALAAEPVAPSPSGPRLLDRLPPGERGAILALETEDHYVRVHRETGSSLILIRMRDAVAEMQGVDGLQVHRSWWVARAAVAGHESDGRNLALKLRGGLLVPVARASVQAVREAGMLDKG